MKVVRYSEELRNAWVEFVAKTNATTVAHQIEWREVIEKGLGHKSHYFVALENDRIRGILPLFITRTWWRSKYLTSIPWIDYGGICSDNVEAEQAILNAAKETGKQIGAEFVEYRSPRAKLSETKKRNDKVTFLLDLTAGEETIWKNFNGKLRNQIRKSQKCGLTCEFGGISILDEFYTVFARNMRDLGTPVWGRSFFEKILIALPNQAEIVLVKDNGKTIAGGLLLKFKKSLYVPSASALREARSKCPNHALYWGIINRACQEGYTQFDFGRSAKESSTFRFKQQWVPEPTELEWQYSLLSAAEIPAINPSNPKYRLAISLWQKMPLSLANLLGPRVVRNFP